MLLIINNMSQVDFSALADVYAMSLQLAGKDSYRNYSEYEQRRRAEEDFYEYLSGTFFACKENALFVWENQGQYVSALRLEPYHDGLLVAGLETKPEEYRKGFAKELLQSLIAYLHQQGRVILYAHVDKRNKASLAAHRAVGFRVSDDLALYIDGTVSRNSYTLRFQID